MNIVRLLMGVLKYLVTHNVYYVKPDAMVGSYLHRAEDSRYTASPLWLLGISCSPTKLPQVTHFRYKQDWDQGIQRLNQG